jgi:hypothetical protein
MDTLDRWLEASTAQLPSVTKSEDPQSGVTKSRVSTATSFRRQLEAELPRIVLCLKPYLMLMVMAGGGAYGGEDEQVKDNEPAADGGGEDEASGSRGRGRAGKKAVSDRTRRVKEAVKGREEDKATRKDQAALTEVGRRCFQFLGRVGGAAHALLDNADADVAPRGGGDSLDRAALVAQWDTTLRLEFSLPLASSSEAAAIWLDSVLPRAANLALTSADRPVKVGNPKPLN